MPQTNQPPFPFPQSPVLDARLSTNPPHSTSYSSVSEYQDSLHASGRDTVDATYSPREGRGNGETVYASNVNVEKYDDAKSENVIRYERVDTTYEMLQGSLNAEQRFSLGLDKRPAGVASGWAPRGGAVWESRNSEPRDYDHTLAAPSPQAGCPVTADGSKAHEYQVNMMMTG